MVSHNCRSKFPEKVRGDKVQVSSGALVLDERRDHLCQQRENRLWILIGLESGRYGDKRRAPIQGIPITWNNHGHKVSWTFVECIPDDLMHESLIVSIF